MRDLFRALPTPAPDYSGVSAVFYGLDSIIVFHEPGGCTGGPAIYDETRMLPCPKKVFSTNLREIDVITGGDDLYIRGIVNTARIVGGDCLCLIPSPVPMLIGTDMEGIAKIIERETKIPTLTCGAFGMKDYDVGVEAAYLALIDKFAGRYPGRGAAVNVLGAHEIDLWQPAMRRELDRIIRSAGYDSVAFWGVDGGLEPIKGCPDAKINIAVSRAAIKPARRLRQLFGTPYVVGYPVGAVMEERFRRLIQNVGGALADAGEAQLGSGGAPLGAGEAADAGGALLAPPGAGKNERGGPKALIITEQAQGNMLRHFLREELGFGPVRVMTFFGMEETLKEAGDSKILAEDDLADLIKAGGPNDLNCCDPILKPFFEPLFADSPARFFPLPHIAISSRLFLGRGGGVLVGKEASGRLKEDLTPDASRRAKLI
ncbi:MAG: hypothetical protein LBK98_03965 [Peptococcaceae bacterium]|nr:hypothetical protein [Peptococcaceae bacterium]